MSTYETIVVDHPLEHVARITMNRPEKRNAISTPMRPELLAAYDLAHPPPMPNKKRRRAPPAAATQAATPAPAAEATVAGAPPAEGPAAVTAPVATPTPGETP